MMDKKYIFDRKFSGIPIVVFIFRFHYGNGNLRIIFFII